MTLQIFDQFIQYHIHLHCNDNLVRAASHSVNYNYTVFVPYLESFCNSALRMVCNKCGCFWWICDTLLWRSYKHSGICCVKSESLALQFANKQHVHRLQCTDLQCWMLLYNGVKLGLWRRWIGRDGADCNITCWCYDVSLWDSCFQHSDPTLTLRSKNWPCKPVASNGNTNR
jgi:hypothetical protein